MITEKSSTLSLRIFSKVLKCAEISRALNWQSTKQKEIGDLWGGRDNKKPREESMWVYEMNLEDRMSLEEKLEILVGMILEKKDVFLDIAEKCQVDIFCSYTTYNTQGGFTLEARLMKELSALNIDLSIDFYALEA